MAVRRSWSLAQRVVALVGLIVGLVGVGIALAPPGDYACGSSLVAAVSGDNAPPLPNVSLPQPTPTTDAAGNIGWPGYGIAVSGPGCRQEGRAQLFVGLIIALLALAGTWVGVRLIDTRGAARGGINTAPV